MGIWSRPLFTNCPDWKVNLGWFKDGCSCKVLLHYAVDAEEEEMENNMENTLGEFVEKRIHEHSKIMGYLTKDQLRGWHTFFDLLNEHNKDRDPNVETVSIHLYDNDANYPYEFSYIRSQGRLMVYSYPPGNVYYCKMKRDRENGLPENHYRVVTFDKDSYKKNFKYVPYMKTIDVTASLEAPARQFWSLY